MLWPSAPIVIFGERRPRGYTADHGGEDERHQDLRRLEVLNSTLPFLERFLFTGRVFLSWLDVVSLAVICFCYVTSYDCHGGIGYPHFFSGRPTCWHRAPRRPGWNSWAHPHGLGRLRCRIWDLRQRSWPLLFRALPGWGVHCFCIIPHHLGDLIP